MTLAALKRKLKPGARLTLTWHRDAHTWGGKTPDAVQVVQRQALASGEGLPGVVAKVAQHQIAIERAPDGRLSYMAFPPAAAFVSDNDTEFTVLMGGFPFLKYRFEVSA